MSANFSDLQSVDTANGADQMMLRLNNGATGPDGFARIEISDLNSVFTSNLTAADAKVKELSAQWSAAYTEVNANSGVFALTVANSGFWNASYDAITGVGTNLGIKEFDYVTINGPFDSARINLPVFTVKRNSATTADMVQVQPVNTTSMFRITTAGSVGININQNYNFIEWSRQVGIRGFVRASRHQQEISKRLLEFVLIISLDTDDDTYPTALSVAILHIRIELDCELSIEQYSEFVHTRVSEILNPA